MPFERRTFWSRLHGHWPVTCALVSLSAFAAEPVYIFTHLAGKKTGSADGIAFAARFFSPQGAAMDGAGNIYISDTLNHTIRRITPDREVSTIAGRAENAGSADGPPSLARFAGPRGLAVDATGNIYVADSLNATIRKIAPSGAVSTLAGAVRLVGSADGNGAAARFLGPADVAVDGLGNVYVADEGNHTIRRITPAGSVTTLAGSAGTAGADDGLGGRARFNAPSGLAVDDDGNIYVADTGNYVIRKITPDGAVTTVAGSAGRRGTRDGNGRFAEFSLPRDVVVDHNDTLFVTDQHAVRKITAAKDVTTFAGVLWSEVGGFEDAVGAAARFSSPDGLASDRAGNLLVADSENHAIREVTADGTVTTFAGPNPTAIHRGDDGPVTTATFGLPQGLAVDGDGAVFVADFGYRDRKIRKISASGIVSSLAQATQPTGIAVNQDGYVYVADWAARVIRRISPGGDAVVFAGSEWSSGNVDGVGVAARFSRLGELALDGEGNLLVGDDAAVRRVTPSGLVSTLAGRQEIAGFANGSTEDARFRSLQGIAVAPDGTIYVADWSNAVIRKISLTAPASQAVTTLAGSPGVFGSADGMGDEARFRGPRGVTVDAKGNVFVTDDSHTVRKITPSGLVTTIGGRAGISGNRDGKGRDASFASPAGIAVDGKGILYVADFSNDAIRKGVPVIPPAFSRQPEGQAVATWEWIRLVAEVSGDTWSSLQWKRNGRELDWATKTILSIGDAGPINAGLYTLYIENPLGALESNATIVGIISKTKVAGAGRELTPVDIRHPNGNVFDQVLLEGAAEAITADAGQVTRTSFVDLDDDIVQVEFSGPGTLSLVLDGAGEPAEAVNYNQPGVKYVKGHAGIVIAGATEATNVSVFSVGKATAVNPALFKEGVKYDGIADIAFIAILSANGKFGGVRTANANYFASRGYAGIYAPGVQFVGPVYVGNIEAFEAATPVLRLGSASDTRITGGDLAQANGAAVQVSGIAQLKFAAGQDAQGNELTAQKNKAALLEDGVDVTARLVVNP